MDHFEGLSWAVVGGSALEASLGHFVGPRMAPKRETVVKLWGSGKTCLSMEREAR